MRRGSAGPGTSQGADVRADHRRRCLCARARDGRASFTPEGRARDPARASAASARIARLSRRAPGSLAPGVVRACRLRARAPDDGGSDDAQSRVQRALPFAAGGSHAPPRSPFRMVTRRVPTVGCSRCDGPRIHRAFSGDRPGRPRARLTDPDGGVQPMNIPLPEFSLVLLIGASGSGKSTFAAKHFKSTEVLSSDWSRAAVSDDPNDQAATKDAFELLQFIAAKRLRAMKLTVVDATNVQPESRKPLIELARAHDVLPVAIVFDVPERVSQERNRSRPDRDFGPHVVRQQAQQLRRSMRGMQREGLRYVWTLSSVEEIDATTITRQRLWTDRRDEHGPFDIIGDIHGCYDELVQLLERLRYVAAVTQNGERSIVVTPPAE